MSHENVELAERALEAFNRRDFDALLELCDPDIEFYSRITELEGGGPFRGHDGIRKWWAELFDVFPNFSAELDEIQDLGHVTVGQVRQHSQGIGSDAPADQTQWFVTEWRERKAVWWHVFLSEAEALEAAGARE